MKILGIDPGYDRLGIAILEKPSHGKEILLFSSCFTTSPKDSIYKRFSELGAEISRVIDLYEPDSMALETLFMTKNQKTGMRVAEARGVIMYEAIRKNIPIFEYSPMQIKTAVTGDGTSDKLRMIKMVSVLVKIDGVSSNVPKLDDEYDAIAVALTHSAIGRT